MEFPEQVRLLEEAGYRWLATTDVWINQKASKAISSEKVGRHTRVLGAQPVRPGHIVNRSPGTSFTPRRCPGCKRVRRNSG